MNDFRDTFLPALKRYRLLIIVSLLVLATGAIYLSGYRVGPGLTIARVGTLELTHVPNGAQVYIDYGLRGTATGGSFPAALIPGAHSVIVSSGDTYPWEEIVTIASNQTTFAAPIIVKKNVPKAKLTDTARTAALAALSSTALPTDAAPMTVGCVHISVSDNRLIANAATTTPGCSNVPYACTGGTCSPTIVYAPIDALKAVMPYPGHQDAVIVQVGDKLYALELDPRTPQFFAPLYDGIKLQAGAVTGG